jgi:rubrerythrin
MSTDSTKTDTSDVTYNLTSILYHALHGAKACDQYVRDAQQEGLEDLADFFREVQEQDRVRVRRAKEFLTHARGN